VAACASVRRSDGWCQGLEVLEGFRDALYGCATRRADAWFELGDALLTTDRLLSLPYLSLDPVHRRGHGSIYAALSHAEVEAGRLRELLAAHLPAGPPVFAVDPTVWARCDAECSPGRGLYYHPSRHSAGQPIVAGWCYQLLVGLELQRNSWTAPVDVRRLRPADNHNRVAAGQIRDLLARLPAHQQVPLVVFDGGFDPVQLQVELAGARAQVLVRVRCDRSFYAAGGPRRDGRPGRPARHRAKMTLADPCTWPTPTATWEGADEQYGQVTVKAWCGLHPKQRTYRDADGQLTIVPGTVVRVHVSCLPGRSRSPKTLWLWWAGPPGTAPDLELLWRAYVRRFDIEHTIRFWKQTLHWTLPRPRTPEQADRFTWAVAAGYTQLRLARGIVTDLRLPWERPLAQDRLTPERVRRRFRAVLAAVGTPASAPKPHGRSPGRPKGTRRGPAPRHPAIKITA
jgi:Transposase DDE domain